MFKIETWDKNKLISVYFVDYDGVIRQKLGTLRIIGFVTNKSENRFHLAWSEFIKTPQKAICLHPVYERIDGCWKVDENTIKSVKLK